MTNFFLWTLLPSLAALALVHNHLTGSIFNDIGLFIALVMMNIVGYAEGLSKQRDHDR